MTGVKKIIVICILLCLPVTVFSQTAQAIEELLNTPAVTYQQAVWLVLEAANTAGPAGFRGEEEAYRHAEQRKWLPKNTGANDRARLDGVALLVMRAFSMKGGIMYNLIQNPHYAYRELVYNNILIGRIVPGMEVSGYNLLYLVNRVLAFQDDNLLPYAFTRDEILAQAIRTRLEEQGVTDTSVRVTNDGVTIHLYGIRFVAYSSVLPAGEPEKIHAFAQLLTSLNVRKIAVSGHAAQALNPEVELHQLSIDRALVVQQIMVTRGNWSADAITVQGFGTQMPIADNDTDEGMFRNRRVEITIVEYQ